MAHVVHGGDIAFNSMLFGPPDANLQSYISQQINAGLQNLTDFGQQIQMQSQQLFERFSGENAMRYIKAIGRAASSLWQTDCIRPITTIGEMQFAPPTMQRWIMAEPTVRKMYHQQRVDGFSHYYVDMEPGLVGPAQYDYRQVMNGVMVFDESNEPDKPEWHATTWFEDLREGDADLTLAEKVDIMQTWESLRSMLKDGHEDPTDRMNSSLD